MIRWASSLTQLRAIGLSGGLRSLFGPLALASLLPNLSYRIRFRQAAGSTANRIEEKHEYPTPKSEL